MGCEIQDWLKPSSPVSLFLWLLDDISIMHMVKIPLPTGKYAFEQQIFFGIKQMNQIPGNTSLERLSAPLNKN